jgi:hypothetical protein
MARSPKLKVALEIEFARRRLDELNRLQASNNTDHVSLLVSKFEERLSSVANTVSRVGSDDRVDVARMVDEKVAGYEHSLSMAKSGGEDISKTVARAQSAVNRAETQALKVIVDNPEPPSQELAQKIDDKIKIAEATLQEVDLKLAGGAKTEATKSAQDQSAVAKDNLAAAKQKIVEGDYKAAITLIEGVEDIVDKIVVISQSTSSEGEVNGESDQTDSTSDNKPPASAD